MRLSTAIIVLALAIPLNSLAGPPAGVVTGPDVTVVNTSDNPVPTVVQSLPSPVLVHDSAQFLTAGEVGPVLNLSVPPEVVLTDIVLTLGSSSRSTMVLLEDRSTGDILVQQSIGSDAGSPDGQLSLHFQSGLQSPSGFFLSLFCAHWIEDNLCEGALMWSGYQP